MTSAVMNNRTVGREWSEPDGAAVYTALFLLKKCAQAARKVPSTAKIACGCAGFTLCFMHEKG